MRLPPFREPVKLVAFSPDNYRLAVESGDVPWKSTIGEVRLWDLDRRRSIGYHQDAAAAFPLPAVRCLSTAAQTTRLRLTAAPGVRLQPADLRNLTAVPEPRATGPSLAYTTVNPDYGGSFRTVPDAARRLHPTAASPDAAPRRARSGCPPTRR